MLSFVHSFEALGSSNQGNVLSHTASDTKQ